METLEQKMHRAITGNAHVGECTHACAKIAEAFAHKFGTWFYMFCTIRIGGHFEFNNKIYTMDKAVQIFKDDQQKT